MSSSSNSVYCAVEGCHNNWKKLNTWKETECEIHEGELHKDCPCLQPFSFHRFPKNENEKQSWIIALRRQNYKPGKYAVVCGIHFVGGIRTKEHPVPTLCLGYNKEVEETVEPCLKKQKGSYKQQLVTSNEPTKNLLENNKYEIIEDSSNNYVNYVIKSEYDLCTDEDADHNAVTDENVHIDTCTQINENLHIDTYTQTNVIMKDASTQYEDPFELHTYFKGNINNVQKISKSIQTNQFFMQWTPSELSDNDCQFYTGLSLAMFKIIVSGILKHVTMTNSKLSAFDQIFMVFARFRLGLLYGDLSRRFGVSTSYICKMTKFWIPLLASEMKVLVQWLPRETISATMPSFFKKLYPNTTCIIDCMEILVEKPKLLYSRAVTYSQYKSHNTFKLLVAIAPNGIIMFVSDCYGGRASDKFITGDCGILNYLLPGDNIMADRGFTIQDLLPPSVSVNMLSFTMGREQLPEEEVTMSRRISSLRVHVERAIRKLRTYRILKGILPLKLSKDIDNIVFICAALCNLQNPIIKQSDEM